MNFRHISIVLKKEIVDLVRDRKTWITAVLLPFLLIPVLMLIMISVMSTTEEEARAHIPIAVQGEHQQVLNALKQNPSIEIVKPDNPEAALEQGEIRAIVKIDPQMEEKLQQQVPATIEIAFNSTNQKSSIAMGILRDSLGGLQQQIVTDRMTSLNLSPALLAPLDIKSTSVATEEQETGGFLSFVVPLILIISSAAGGMAAATDLVAGERERGTLESLLTAPVNGMSVLAGKLITVAMMGCISAIASTCSIIFGFSFVPKIVGEQMGDFPFSLGFLSPGNIAVILLFLFLLSTMFAAVMLALSSLAKSFKEAQTYMSPVILAGMVPAYMTMSIAPNEVPLSYLFIPILNVTVVFKKLLYGMMETSSVMYAIASTLLFVVIAIWVAARLFRRESLIAKA
jgi:sodium transport system permease protein